MTLGRQLRKEIREALFSGDKIENVGVCLKCRDLTGHQIEGRPSDIGITCPLCGDEAIWIDIEQLLDFPRAFD